MIEQLKKPVVIISLLTALLIGMVLALTAVLIFDSLEDDERETAELVVPQGTVGADSPGVGVVGTDGQLIAPERLDRDDLPPGSPEFEKVGEAAREAAGGGTVISIERSNDLGEAYEVEIMTANGEVDVALGSNLREVPNLRYDD